jgi:hypothetical protein
MSKMLIFAFSVLITGFQIAHAEQHGGADQDEEACIRDVTRFCRKLATSQFWPVCSSTDIAYGLPALKC